MPENSLETAAGASYAVLVTLSWSNLPVSPGDPEKTTKKYAAWTEDIDINGDGSEVFESAPNLEVDLGEVHGGTDDKPGELTISREYEPFNILRSGLVHPRIEVVVEQVDPTDPVLTRRVLFKGRIGKIKANPGGRASLVSANLNGVKAELNQVRLGIPATPTCQWAFGGEQCGYDKEATKQTGEVLSIGSPERVSVRLSVGSGTSPNNRYKRGIIKVGGLLLTIRKSYDDGFFDLFKVPPPWIVGLPAELFEGCDKQYSTCVQFQRQHRFMGLGIRIPDRQPLFES